MKHAALTTLALAALALFALAPGGALIADPGDHKAKDKAHAKSWDGDRGHYDEAALTAKYKAGGWTGLRTEKTERGQYAIVEVASNSPAAEAGLQPGDVLLAMNGVALKAENKAELKAAKAKMQVGGEVTYVVLRDGEKKKVAVSLAPVPEAVLAQWLERARAHHAEESTQMAEKNR